MRKSFKPFYPDSWIPCDARYSFSSYSSMILKLLKEAAVFYETLLSLIFLNDVFDRYGYFFSLSAFADSV